VTSLVEGGEMHAEGVWRVGGRPWVTDSYESATRLKRHPHTLPSGTSKRCAPAPHTDNPDALTEREPAARPATSDMPRKRERPRSAPGERVEFRLGPFHLVVAWTLGAEEDADVEKVRVEAGEENAARSPPAVPPSGDRGGTGSADTASPEALPAAAAATVADSAPATRMRRRRCRKRAGCAGRCWDRARGVAQAHG
jgi:hypothetical protein